MKEEVKHSKIFTKNMEAYDKYYKSCTIKNSTSKNTTYKMYMSRMIDFLTWLEENYPKAFINDKKFLKEIVYTLEEYMSHCLERGNNSKTINNKLTAISSYYFWASKRNIVEAHPFDGKLDRMKKGDYDKVRDSYFLTEDQLTIIEEHFKNSDAFTKRDYLTWRILLDTAGRRNAIINLKVSNFNMQAGLLESVREKGSKVVDLILMDDTVKLLKEYIEENNLKEDEYIFFSEKKGKDHPMHGHFLSALTHRVGAIVGCPKLYPHSIRKTRINLLYEEHGLDVAARYANHNDTKTTRDHYIKATNSSDLRRLVNKK